jgi:hypothetical protein
MPFLDKWSVEHIADDDQGEPYARLAHAWFS